MTQLSEPDIKLMMIKILDDDHDSYRKKEGNRVKWSILNLLCVCVKIAFECEFWSCVLRETLDRIVLHKKKTNHI